MTIDLVLDEIPIAAIATHDATPAELDEFRRFVALDFVVGVCEVVGAHASPIVEWLLRQPLERLCLLAEQPLLRVWLADARRAAAGDPAFDDDRSEHNAALAWLLLASLHEMAPLGTDWTVQLPSRHRRAPIGADHYVLSSGDGTGVARAVADDDGVRISDERGGSAFLRRTPSGDLELAESDGYATSPRRFPFGDIELLDHGSFPELLRTSAGAVPSSFAAGELAASLADAFELLLDVWPESVPHVLTCFRGAIAIDAPPGHVYSASVQELPLILQLTIRPDDPPILLAETIIHETAHVKLDTLLAVTALAENENEEGYHHPWRPDARPLRGVFLGAHAFANVGAPVRAGRGGGRGPRGRGSAT